MYYVRINNLISNTYSCSPNGYQYYSNATFTVVKGSVCNWTINAFMGGTIQAGFWIDWNNDGIYASSEGNLGTPTVMSQIPAPITGSFAVPPGVGPVNNLKMRVRLKDVWLPFGVMSTSMACTTNSSGETEDYNLSVVCQTSSLALSASSTVVCQNSPGSISLSANGADSYTWFPGFSNNASINVSPTSTSIYTLAGTYTNGCSAGIQTVQISYNNPVVSANLSGAACVGQAATLIASGASSYVWQPGSLTGASPTPLVFSNTTYTVVGTDADGCLSLPVTVPVSVLPSPTLASAMTPPGAICAGDSYTLNVSGATNYVWNPGNLSGSNIVVTPNSSVNYTVTGTTGSCSDNNVLNAIVNPLPSVLAQPSSTTICYNTAVDLSASGASTYSWEPFSLSGSNVSKVLSGSFIFTVTGEDANGCKNIATVNVSVNPAPAFNYTTSGLTVTIFNNSSSSLTGFVWNFGDLTVSNQFQPGTHTFATAGTYVVELEANSPAPCPKVTTTFTVTVPSSLQGGTGLNTQPALNNLVSIYPNPAGNRIYFMNHGINGLDSKVEIYSASGKLVKQIDNAGFSGDQGVDVSGLAPGAYFIKLHHAGGDMVKTFIKN